MERQVKLVLSLCIHRLNAPGRVYVPASFATNSSRDNPGLLVCDVQHDSGTAAIRHPGFSSVGFDFLKFLNLPDRTDIQVIG